MAYTQLQLDNLKNAYASGVLKVREGDTWLEYGTLSQMKTAIDTMERELNTSPNRARGTRVISIKSGY